MADHSRAANSPVRFGVFELDPSTGDLRKHGVRVKLQDQPFAVLLILLEKPGQLVTREELQQRLWPANTFVEFDKGIYNAMKRLREALGDGAGTPRYIETIPKRGYRLLAEVHGIGTNATSAPVEQPPPKMGLTSTTLGQGTIAPQVEAATGHRRAKTQWITVGVIFALVCGMGIWRFWRNHAEGRMPPLEVVPLVGLSDKVLKPAFSPDGNQVAFYILGSENAGIYTTMVGSEKSLRLTSSSGDCCPRWSPDGRQVAFFRTSDDGVAAVYVIPAFGGTEHRLYSGPAGFSHRAVDWSPDGKTLAFTESHEDRTHNWIALLSLADSSVRRLTSPSALEFDYGPAFSPDGSTVAFIRGTLGGAPTDLYVVSSAGGAPRRLTYDNTWIYPPPTWTPDGRDIVFSSARGGFINLWRISSSGGTPWPVAGGGYGAVSPSISPKGNQLVYSQTQPDLRNIWRLDLRDRKHRQGPPRQVIGEKGWKGRPYFSPEGKRIAFESWQSGYLEIRACDSDGSNCGQLTSLRGTAGGARWSPDGRYVAFEFRPKEHSEIYLLKLDGSTPQLLPTLPGADNLGPNWSRDGKWIYFYSDQGGGPFQIWKVQLNGGPPVKVTRNGGAFAAESADGRTLYYSKYSAPGIWKMPLEGGEESRVLDQPYREPTIPSGAGWLAWWDWAVARDGIYFLNFATKPYATLEFFEFATQKTFPIWTLPKPPGFGLSISADEKSILYVQNEIGISNIMLVKNFR